MNASNSTHLAAMAAVTTYDPGALLDYLRAKLRLKNDRALANALGTGAPLISKVRSGQKPLSASLMIRIHEVTGLSIREIRDLMGDRRGRCRVGHTHEWSDQQRAAHAGGQLAGGGQ